MGSPELFTVAHYPTAGLDVTLDMQSHGRGLRIWLEGIAGGSWFEHSRKPIDPDDATFTAVRAIVAPRIGGCRAAHFTSSPTACSGCGSTPTSMSSPIWRLKQSSARQVGLYKLARIGVELQHRKVERIPAELPLGRNPERLAAMVQAAAEF